MKLSETCGNCGKRNPKGICEITGKKMNPGLSVGWCTYYEPITYESMMRREKNEQHKQK